MRNGGEAILFVDVVAGQATALFPEQAVAVPDEAVGFVDFSVEGGVGVADGLVEAGFLGVGFDELVSSKRVSFSSLALFSIRAQSVINIAHCNSIRSSLY